MKTWEIGMGLGTKWTPIVLNGPPWLTYDIFLYKNILWCVFTHFTNASLCCIIDEAMKRYIDLSIKLYHIHTDCSEISWTTKLSLSSSLNSV